MLADLGFTDITVGPPVDTFGGAGGESNARTFDVKGYPFIAYKPASSPDGSTEPNDGAQP
jgi:hypothetical protein